MLENRRLVVSHHSPQGENDSGGRGIKINIINSGIEEINDREVLYLLWKHKGRLS